MGLPSDKKKTRSSSLTRDNSDQSEDSTLMEKLSKLLDDKLSAQEKSIKDHFDARFDAIESRVHDLEENRDQVRNDITDHSNQLQKLRNEISFLRNELKRTQSDLSGVEQHGRRWAVRIYGIKAPNHGTVEPAKQIASNFFKDNLDLTIPVKEIDCAHSVGRVENGKQPLLVRFFGRDHVDTLISERKSVVHETLIMFCSSSGALNGIFTKVTILFGLSVCAFLYSLIGVV